MNRDIQKFIEALVAAEKNQQSIPVYFFNDLLSFLQEEPEYLKNDKQRYLAYLVTPLQDRVKDMILEGSIEDIHAHANAPKSPIRNGMILFGLYKSILDN
jgi:hypothetical protein